MKKNNTPANRPLALVTGASSGIGAAYARRLAAEGYNVALVARRKQRLEELASELQAQYGVSTEVIAADLTAGDALKTVETRIARAKNLEFLVNNAGFGTLGNFFDNDLDTQDQMHRLHVIAPMRLTHAALTGMVARNKGSIVNVSSVAAFLMGPGQTSYCATKAWMNAFTEGIYMELKSIHSAVKVQALCPGFTDSEFINKVGLERNVVPEMFWMPAEDVVAASLRGLRTGTLIVVPDWRYEAAIALMRFVPKSFAHAFAIETMRSVPKANRKAAAAAG